MSSLTSQLASESSTLQHTKAELAALQSDFDKYKVRAQSVLRRHQSLAISQAETEAKQQVSELKQLTDSLKTKLDDSMLVCLSIFMLVFIKFEFYSDCQC